MSAAGGKKRRAPLSLGAALVALLCLVPLAQGEPAQNGSLRVVVSGRLSPNRLPRTGVAPISVSVGGEISTTDASEVPQLRQIVIAINRHGRLDPAGLPLCRIAQIDPSTTRGARQACGPSLVGEGSFSANVKIPEQSPFPSKGKVLAFNGRYHGKPAILAHIYGTDPVPTSYVLPFLIGRGRGTFGTVLKASLPQVTGDWGFVTGVQMTLGRRFGYRGRSRTYLAAGCPAAPGFRSVFFPLLRSSFYFAGGKVLGTTITRECRVR